MGQKSHFLSGFHISKCPNVQENKAMALVSHQIEMLSCLCYMWHIKLVVPNFRWYENMVICWRISLKCRFPVPTYRVNLVGLEWGPGIWILTPFSPHHPLQVIFIQAGPWPTLLETLIFEALCNMKTFRKRIQIEGKQTQVLGNSSTWVHWGKKS